MPDLTQLTKWKGSGKAHVTRLGRIWASVFKFGMGLDMPQPGPTRAMNTPRMIPHCYTLHMIHTPDTLVNLLYVRPSMH